MTLASTELRVALAAIERGDFRVALAEDSPDIDAEAARSINAIALRLSSLTAEIRRISAEIGTYGMFGGQSEVYGLEGDWKTLQDDFNGMAANLTNQMRDFANVTMGRPLGGSTDRVTVPARGETLQLKYAINDLMDGRTKVAVH